MPFCRVALTLAGGILLISLVVSPERGWAAGEEPPPAVKGGAVSTGPSAEIEALKVELAADPGNVRSLTRLGWLLLEVGDPERAAASFEEVLRLNPRSHEAKLGKGTSLARKGELAEAEAVLKDALVLNPNPVRVHYELGCVYERLGATDKAMDEFKKGIEKHRQGR